MLARMVESFLTTESQFIVFLVRSWLGTFVWILMTHFVYDMLSLRLKLGDQIDAPARIRRHQAAKGALMALIAVYELTITVRTYFAREDPG